jgi:intracellular septation protein A
MWYLLIPVVCFILFAGLFWAFFLVLVREQTWKGRIAGLEVILSVLMTAKGYEPHLLMKVPRRVTSLKMTFSEYAVRCEVPLITRLQQSRKERYLAVLRDLNLEEQVSKDESDQDVLEFRVEGPPGRAAGVTKEAFLRLFEVDPTRSLEFRVTANTSDWNVIELALRGRRPGDKVDLPVAATHDQEDDADRKNRIGCFWGLAGLFLLPIPFVVAYLEYGFVAASAVVVAIVIGREIYGRWQRGLGRFKFRDALKMIVVGLAGATIYLDEPLFLQLIPTAVLSVVAVAVVLREALQLPPWWEWPDKPLPRTGQLLLSLAFVATCIGGVAVNEYLRASVSLTAWVWFFAFVRIELVFGFLTALIPFLSHQWRYLMKTERQRELWWGNEQHGESE